MYLVSKPRSHHPQTLKMKTSNYTNIFVVWPMTPTNSPRADWSTQSPDQTKARPSAPAYCFPEPSTSLRCWGRQRFLSAAATTLSVAVRECLWHSDLSGHFCELSGWMFILTQTQPPSCQHLVKRKARYFSFLGLITVYRYCCLLYGCLAHCEGPININWWTRSSEVWLQLQPSTIFWGSLYEQGNLGHNVGNPQTLGPSSFFSPSQPGRSVWDK